MGNSTRQTYTGIPAWAEIEAFEKRLNEALEKIASARAGGVTVEEFMPADGKAARGFRTVAVEPRDYSPAICVLIEDAWSLISQGEVGVWIASERRMSLDRLLKGLRHDCEAMFEKAGRPGTSVMSANDWLALQAEMAKERELRFFGDLAVIWGRVHWKRWIPRNTSRKKIERFSNAATELQDAVRGLMDDRYLQRRLSPQELNAFEKLKGMIGVLRGELELLGAVPRLHPYKRFEKDGRGVRSEIAAELVFLCELCFGGCSSEVLVGLIESLDIELPAKLEGWIADQLKVGRELANAYEAAQYVVNVCLPPQEKSDPRRPNGNRRPWLPSDLSNLRLDGYAIGLGR